MTRDTALVAGTLPGQLTVYKGSTIRRYVDTKKWFFVGKRLIDILVSVLVIVLVLSWLLPLLAILIKIDSKGPAFFLQKRVGRGGRSFTCIKLRTLPSTRIRHMQRAAIEPATTRLGAFLRQSNLDELPQFFNVLSGSMSIVGPRPHMHADCHTFSQFIPQYKFRNLVQPGITGLAQVKGYHGTVRSQQDALRRYEWDAHYVRHASLGLDLSIMFITVLQRFRFLLAASSK
jgi:putative colanic acid biosynthesis UDP-glucose lipid carrier transferase